MATEKRKTSNYETLNISFAKKLSIAIVVSEWNHSITNNLFNACKKTLIQNGLMENKIKKFIVPGSFELVFASNKLSKESNYDAIITIGSIIRGETPHFDYICQATSNGIQKINLLSKIPIIFGVLTDNNIQQATDRSGGKYGNKGVELALSALKMILFNNNKD